MGGRSAHARVRGRPEGGGDGFLLSQERRWNHVVPAQAGTQRGEVERRGLSRVPGMDFCFRRKDGGTTSCPRKRVPRGGRWSGVSPAVPGMDSCFRRKDGGTTSCPRKRVPRGGRWGGVSPAVPGMDFCFRRKDGGTTSCPRKRVPRGGRWGGVSPAVPGMDFCFRRNG